MPVAGRKPKEDRTQVRHRNPATHDWAEVEDTPYAGERPDLPPRFRIDPNTGASVDAEWPAPTMRWWAVVSKMPHCRLWTDSDWDFALATAEVHARFAEGGSAAELRIREKLLGTTLDARRDLRIRYVKPKPATAPAAVARLDDYRNL